MVPTSPRNQMWRAISCHWGVTPDWGCRKSCLDRRKAIPRDTGFVLCLAGRLTDDPYPCVFRDCQPGFGAEGEGLTADVAGTNAVLPTSITRAGKHMLAFDRASVTEPSSSVPERLSIGTFYFGQSGTFNFGATVSAANARPFAVLE